MPHASVNPTVHLIKVAEELIPAAKRSLGDITNELASAKLAARRVYPEYPNETLDSDMRDVSTALDEAIHALAKLQERADQALA